MRPAALAPALDPPALAQAGAGAEPEATLPLPGRSGPATGSQPAEPIPRLGPQEAEGVLAALEATGASHWEALGLLALQDPGVAWPLITQTLDGVRHQTQAVAACDALAEGDPGVANRAFSAWLNGRTLVGDLWLLDKPWLTALTGQVRVGGHCCLVRCSNLIHLPEGLEARCLSLEGCVGLEMLPDQLTVREVLDLDGCANLTRLPEGLTVVQLSANRCGGLVALPKGLVVRDRINLRGCGAWDGRIPADTVFSRIFTDLHPVGMTRTEWRQRHPHGEV
jgi:hypothetical protein